MAALEAGRVDKKGSESFLPVVLCSRACSDYIYIYIHTYIYIYIYISFLYFFVVLVVLIVYYRVIMFVFARPWHGSAADVFPRSDSDFKR